MSAIDALLQFPEFVDSLYRQYQRDAGSVAPEWARLFERFDREDTAATPRAPSFLTERGALPDGLPRDSVAPGIQIYDLVHTYRQFGHLAAVLDPLGRSPRQHPFLELGQFGFNEADLDQVVTCDGYHGLESGSLREHIELLRETYCGPIGVEYMDVMEKEQRDWLQQRMEPIRNRPRLSQKVKRELLRQVIHADTFEETLGNMYPGSKRFSLEGATTLITLLRILLEESAQSGVEQLVFGMAHRGRLNVLAHVLEKPLSYILAEFEGRPQASELQGYGDVKYHLGYSSDYRHPSGAQVHLSLAFNPSHLETINPVVEGIVRAKQRRHRDPRRERILPILVHGDAAFTGQGVVTETLSLAGLEGYETGGTLHVIVNNQVGFTAEPEETRSTRYASDLAMGVRAPVFHVNADHPEAVYLVGQLALAYRQTFHSDVVVDLVCFRRHGHNEMDDASFTQPVMAKLIKSHSSVSKIYAEKLKLGGTVSEEDVSSMVDEVRGRIRQAREEAKELPAQVSQRFGGAWKGLKPNGAWSADTSVRQEDLERVARALVRAPEDWNWHRRLRRLMERRAAMVLEDQPLDWGCAETLAYGSLLLEGTRVRLSGQDSARGTFSHRHAVYTDMETGERYVPLNHLDERQADFEIINSPLSEEAVLGFEYGYSSADPWSLVIWEAQFGDFANGAQVIIDQLIASAEHKWGRMSGLVMLLPHGYEGQGPEHSSARLERFLELCAENNLQVANPTTPAQIFHVLRRQMHRQFRKPLVVMSPKSLLRHPSAVSRLSELTDGQFANVLDDPDVGDREKVKRVLLCSGKVYYTLHEARRERDAEEVAVVRLEQLYPYPLEELRELLASYPNLERLTWVQEEPRNMGAWRNLLHRFQQSAPRGVELCYAGRDSRATPATGAYEVHRLEESDLVKAAFREDARDQVVRRDETARSVREKVAS